jgi:hypothetical protein
MILSIIRLIGRSALRSKWKRQDARLRAELIVELNIPREITQRQMVERAYKSSTGRGSIEVSGELLSAFLSHEEFVARLNICPGDSIFASALDDNFIGMFRDQWIHRKPEPPEPVPAADPPGYTSVTR